MDTESSTDIVVVDGTTGASVHTVGDTATKPERNKRGYWVEFLNNLTTEGTDVQFPSRDELMRVRSTIVTGAARLGIAVKTKSERNGTTLHVRRQTEAEVAAKTTK